MPAQKATTPKKSTALSDRKISDVLKSSNPLVFVSHDSRDAELAEAFSKLLSSISAGMLKSFRSSDKKGSEGIEFGVEWYPEVMSKIDSASDVVCLLTPRSLERPWILYEAGVAKGKMNTPVYGVAIGISLSSAATGPFAQFQNCGEDEDSLNKLVLQLMSRVQGAEPDKDTVRMQVETFRAKAKSLTEGMAKSPKANKNEITEVEGSSVAKLFEEVKVMFRDLPHRMDARSSRPFKMRMRSVRPEMIFELEEGMGFGGQPGIGLLILASIFKDDAPWLYELGVQAYRSFTSGLPNNRMTAIRRFGEACEFTAQHPMFRDLHESRDVFIALMETNSYIERLLQLSKRVDPTLPKKKPEA